MVITDNFDDGALGPEWQKAMGSAWQTAKCDEASLPSIRGHGLGLLVMPTCHVCGKSFVDGDVVTSGQDEMDTVWRHSGCQVVTP